VADSYIEILTTTGKASTADIARLDVTGDIEVRVDVAANTYFGSTQIFLDKWGGSDAAKAYYFRINSSGQLALTVWDGTTSFSSSSNNPGWSGGERWQLRATLDLDNGSSQREATYYRRESGADLTNNTGWSLISSHTSTVISAIAASNKAVFFPGDNTAGGVAMVGKFYRGLVYNGIGGTIVTDWKPMDPTTRTAPPSNTTWNDQAPSAANTYAMAGVENTDWQYVNLSAPTGHLPLLPRRDYAYLRV
jgi:hypothetical protein